MTPTPSAPAITVGFIPRERYELAAESLRTLLDNTAEPYELIIVAPAVPNRYRQEMDAVIAERPATIVLEHDRPLLPAASKNLVLEHATGNYVAFVENDVLYPRGWLRGLVAACEEFPADVASPLIREGAGGQGALRSPPGPDRTTGGRGADPDRRHRRSP